MATFVQRLRRFIKRAESGQGVAEFAMILPVLAVVSFGLVELGRGVSAQSALVAAAGEAARYCARVPGDTDGTRTRLESELAGRVEADLEQTVCPMSGSGTEVTVIAAASYAPITPVFGGATVQLTASATAMTY